MFKTQFPLIEIDFLFLYSLQIKTGSRAISRLSRTQPCVHPDIQTILAFMRFSLKSHPFGPPFQPYYIATRQSSYSSSSV